MKCDAMREWFSDRLDGALDPDRSAQMDQHLATCASCVAEFEALRLAIDRLHHVGPPLTSADERAAIMAAIDREAEDRLVASAVAGDTIERRSGVFKRAILLPQPEPTSRHAIGKLAWMTHIASFGVGIAAAALFWFGGARDASPTTGIEPLTHDRAQVPIVPTAPSPPIEPAITPATIPAIDSPSIEHRGEPTPATTPPPEMLLRVSGDLTIIRNGERGAGSNTPSSAPWSLKPGDVLEAESAGKWRIIVGEHGALEVQAEPAAPRAPTISRGPMIAIDLDPAPLQRLAARMRSSMERFATAVDRAAKQVPETPVTTATSVAVAPPIESPPSPTKTPIESTVGRESPGAGVGDVAAAQPESTRSFSPRAPVIVRYDEAGLRLETAGSPIEVVPALIQRLRDDDDQVVAIVVARLELVREEFERDPRFPRVTPKVSVANPSLFGLMTSLVVSAPQGAAIEDPYAYWNRWFDTCADAIVARETYGTW